MSLGTWGHGGPRTARGSSVGWSGNDDGLAEQAIVQAFEAGIDHWDTADVYGDGHAEELIGRQWPKVPREKVFLATKVGWDPGEYDHFYHPDVMRRNMERSLRLLRTDRVELMYFHHCDFGPDDRYFDGAMEVMTRFREEGKTRFIGLSDWSASRVMRFVDRVDPAVVQPYRNVIDDDYVSSGLRDWVDAHDAGVAFFSPIKHGLLLGKYSEPQQFPEGDFRRNVPEFGDAAALQRISRAAKEVAQRFASHREPLLHALIGTLLADATTGCVLLGQRNARQVAAAAAVGESLTREEAEWVRGRYRAD